MAGAAYPTRTYIARRRLLVAGSWRNPGDAVPEAANWRNLHSYISAGFIRVEPYTGTTEDPVQRVGKKHSNKSRGRNTQPSNSRGVTSTIAVDNYTGTRTARPNH